LAPADANLLLPAIDPVAHGLAGDHLARLAQRDAAQIAADGATVSQWAEDHFDVDAMIDATLDLFSRA
jgi:hypothetical protein